MPSGSADPSRWDENMRAFWLPVLGTLAVVIVVWLAAVFPLPHDIFVAALTALTTLTASAAGHAASRSKPPTESQLKPPTESQSEPQAESGGSGPEKGG